ncbi:hypothetical protein B0T18DRAFT_420142 [Schizothecium vesticola]|uniref:Uncharacterized protein n=1 Tax=Schizothecium vesticola TaxID=314040 RepID=A0AA40ELA1_9PEZI|nr:hypothetical protein B0T18DRAFT_420142 [Schizothecium vesticola]
MKRWRDVSPGAGANISEADINEPDFQRLFYGSYCPRLYKLKQNCYSTGPVLCACGGGERGMVSYGANFVLSQQNGRLCRK